jgi:hypothetical protein
MQRAAAACGLEIGQNNALPTVAQQLLSDSDQRHGAVELQVAPGDPEQLPSPEPEGEGHHVGGLQAVALHFAQEGLGLLGREGPALTPWDLHAVGDGGHVAGQDPLLFGPAKGPLQDGPDDPASLWGISLRFECREHFAHVGRGELVELHGVDGGSQVPIDRIAVDDLGSRAHGAREKASEPVDDITVRPSGWCCNDRLRTQHNGGDSEVTAIGHL